MEFPPVNNSWERNLAAADPPESVHTHSIPGPVEVAHLIFEGVPSRVGRYVSSERSNGKEPIFDLNGISLSPPYQGPYGGVPLGGVGSGAIGRGFRGDFRRWSLTPGKYSHGIVHGDQLCVRIKRSGRVFSKVLSILPPKTSQMKNWDFLDLSAAGQEGLPSSARYYAVFPRCWTVYDNPVPNTRVVVRQVSPFIPHDYTSSSLPTSIFHVTITNTGDDEIEEASVMFSFQNSNNLKDDLQDEYVHAPFKTNINGSNNKSNNKSNDASDSSFIFGVLMAHPTIVNTKTGTQGNHEVDEEIIDNNSFAIAVYNERDDKSSVSFCNKFNINKTNKKRRDVTKSDNDDKGGAYGRPSGAMASEASETSRLRDDSDGSDQAIDADFVWRSFHVHGEFKTSKVGSSDSHELIRNKAEQTTTRLNSTDKEHQVASALCVKHRGIKPGESSNTSFSLSWDFPIARFAFPNFGYRYYTRFFGRTGLASINIAQFALAHAFEWERSIVEWQNKTVGKPLFATDLKLAKFGNVLIKAGEMLSNESTSNGVNDNNKTPAEDLLQFTYGEYYNYHLFNELYYLVDGGCIWSDSSDGTINEVDASFIKYDSAKESFISCENNSGGAGDDRLPPSSSRVDRDVASSSTATTRSSADTESNLTTSELHSSKTNEGGSNDNNDARHSPKDAAIEPADKSKAGGTSSSSIVIDEKDSSYSFFVCNLLGICLFGSCCGLHCGNVSQSLLTDDNFPENRKKRRIEKIVRSLHLAAKNCLSFDKLVSLKKVEMAAHNKLANCSNGSQQLLGQFLYLEGHEYLMYNTYDVHFYSSFSLLMLFPQLEYSIQRDFARSVNFEDKTQRLMLGSGNTVQRKARNVVPHDLGSPTEEPWNKTNIYNFQDVSKWKDLGPKFILQIYRDYIYMSDRHDTASVALKFLHDQYPICKVVMEQNLSYIPSDLDDGMIRNQGFPDQTYDIWSARGVHAYCGGLWIAATMAMKSMAELFNDHETAEKYAAISIKAREVYIRELWVPDSSSDEPNSKSGSGSGSSGGYLKYDSSNSGHSDSIMADMLAGHWYSMVCRLEPYVVNHDIATKCLHKIYSYNVIAYSSTHPIINKETGEHDYFLKGAVNGTKPNGLAKLSALVDKSCLQSREVWTGTTYGLAACMIHEAKRAAASVKGAEKDVESSDLSVSEDFSAKSSHEGGNNLVQYAFATAQGIHDAGWQRYGYWFATPEAWEEDGRYRSLGYMRPLAIWAMQYAREWK